jgi:IS30 family transposase
MAGTLGGYGEKYRHISLEARDRIAEMKSLGHTVTEIAEALGRFDLECGR